jgi:cytochrome bd ubiquinol oxidase subunit II
MVDLWFFILCLMLIIFVVLDGWNFGAGAVHLIVAKKASERRQVIAALGPLWSWSEVWLVASGGVLALAFPRIMALAFSGFYLALFLLLWSLILRGVAIEVGGHINDPLWQAFWDLVFAVSNVLLIVLLGVAMGNVIRGVPLDDRGKFYLPLFTNFGVRGNVGLLDWYTISVGIFSLVTLCAHGSTYLTLKTEGVVNDRTFRISRRLWTVFFLLLPMISFSTAYVRSGFFSTLITRPLGWLSIMVLISGTVSLVAGIRRRRELWAFRGSCGIIVALLAGLSVSLFPTMLYSTFAPAYSVTAYQGAAARSGLYIGIVWWPIAFALAMVYLAFIARYYRGKAKETQDTQGFY